MCIIILMNLKDGIATKKTKKIHFGGINYQLTSVPKHIRTFQTCLILTPLILMLLITNLVNQPRLVCCALLVHLVLFSHSVCLQVNGVAVLP